MFKATSEKCWADILPSAEYGKIAEAYGRTLSEPEDTVNLSSSHLHNLPVKCEQLYDFLEKYKCEEQPFLPFFVKDHIYKTLDFY